MRQCSRTATASTPQEPANDKTRAAVKAGTFFHRSSSRISLLSHQCHFPRGLVKSLFISSASTSASTAV